MRHSAAFNPAAEELPKKPTERIDALETQVRMLTQYVNEQIMRKREDDARMHDAAVRALGLSASLRFQE